MGDLYDKARDAIRQWTDSLDATGGDRPQEVQLVDALCAEGDALHALLAAYRTRSHARADAALVKLEVARAAIAAATGGDDGEG